MNVTPLVLELVFCISGSLFESNFPRITVLRKRLKLDSKIGLTANGRVMHFLDGLCPGSSIS